MPSPLGHTARILCAAGQLAHDAGDDTGRVPAAQEVIAQSRSGPLRPRPCDRRQAATSHLPCPLERRGGLHGSDGRVDQRRGDATSAELGAEPRDAITAGAARLHPVAGEAGVVEIATAREIVDDGIGDVGGSAPADEPAGEVGASPGTA